MNQDWRVAALFLASVLTLGLIVGGPLVYSIGLSFYASESFISPSRWVGLGNYLELLADPLPLMFRGDADLVDPQLRRLVRMHVVDGGCHAHDLTIQHGHGQMMAGVCEELGQPAGMDVVIEHALRHFFED